MCVIVQYFVVIGQIVAEIRRLLDFFSKWRPSAILDLCARLDHPRRVFGGVQNLVGIDAVVSIIRKCWYLTSLTWKCLITPLLEVLAGFYLIHGEQSHRDPQKGPPWTEALHKTYRSLRSIDPPVSAQITLLPNHPKSYALQWARHSHKSAHFRWGICAPSNTWFLGTTTQTASRSV